MYLAHAYRGGRYDDARIWRMSPFVIVGPLVNALLIRSSLALADIAERIGENPAPHRTAAATIRSAMQEQLWDSRDARYYSRKPETR